MLRHLRSYLFWLYNNLIFIINIIYYIHGSSRAGSRSFAESTTNPGTYYFHGTGLQNLPPLFDLKIAYSYVIRRADSEYNLGLHGTTLVSEIFAFYHLLENALGRPGCRGHVHLGQNLFFFELLFL